MGRTFSEPCRTALAGADAAGLNDLNQKMPEDLSLCLQPIAKGMAVSTTPFKKYFVCPRSDRLMLLVGGPAEKVFERLICYCVLRGIAQVTVGHHFSPRAPYSL